MDFFYFPENIYRMAHLDYLEKTGKDVRDVHMYCMQNVDFFVEVAFSYVEGTPYPAMKEQA